MTNKKVLVVDDEEDIRDLVAYTLSRENYQVRTACDGEQALEEIAKEKPDLVVLDLMLPGIDGLEVCRRIKSQPENTDVCVIMLTAKSEESDQVIGLGMGADNYMVKPFSSRVLVAKIGAVLRRNAVAIEETSNKVVEQGILKIDPICHEVYVSGEELALTPIEFNIIYTLARKPGKVFSRSQIIDEILGEDVIITERTIDVHVVALRKKLKDNAKMIDTVRGIGYRVKI